MDGATAGARDGTQHRPVPVVPGGLTEEQARARAEEVGRNEVAARPPAPVWHRVLAQLRDPLLLVLLGAAALTLATGDLTDAAVILLVIVVNTSVGVSQEVRAEAAIAALSRLAAPHARVVRDGVERDIPAVDLVPGDLIHLAEGDVVPADATIVDGPGLLLDESALTGESVPVDRGRDLQPQVASGTVVLRGRAVAVVEAIGPDSALGRIAALLDSSAGQTPLQRRLIGLGRVLASAALLLCVLVAVLGLFRGQPLELMVITAVSLAVAAVPESLPAVVTLSLALGARRMAERNAIVRRLPAVETLGSVTVLATDKTGTLTEGRMVLEQLWTPGSPDGAPVPVGDGGGLPERMRELLIAGVLCNDATLTGPSDPSAPAGPDEAGPGLGDPTETALLAAAAAAGLHRAELAAAHPRVAERPFDSATRRMTTVQAGDPAYRVVVKGAPDALAGLLIDPPELLAESALAAELMASEGYRVLALARAERDELPADLAEAETGLRLLGLVGILDPPRPAAASTLQACRDAGITPVLVTGDHPATAAAVAGRLGIGTGAGMLATGAELAADAVPDLLRVRVFARTSPEQKLDIVDAWQAAGAVVAMTGDGVNDGPALRRADIGVAMGRRGTEVARQAADLVLADDDLATVVAAVEEGRRVYANVRRFLAYGLSGGAAEIALMLLGPFLGLAVPLLPAQILWVNLVTHGLTGVALGAEPPEPGSMTRPPRPPDESVLGAGLWQRIARLAAVVTVLSLGLGVWAHAAGLAWQSMVFVSLAAAQLGVALGSRARPGSRTNPALPLAVLAALLLTVAGVYLPLLADLLGTVPLSVTELGLALAAAPLGWLAMRVERRLARATDR